MRYTTIIDITEIPQVYNNQNVRLVYLHLVLRSGYHQEDKDQVKTSIRKLSAELDLSVSAVRHALNVLEQQSLLARIEGGWSVKKWLIETFPSKEQARKKTAQQLEKEQRQEDEKKQWQSDLKAAVESSTREELAEWLDELKSAPAGKRVYHRGAKLWNCEDHINWLTKIVQGK